MNGRKKVDIEQKLYQERKYTLFMSKSTLRFIRFNVKVCLNLNFDLNTLFTAVYYFMRKSILSQVKNRRSGNRKTLNVARAITYPFLHLNLPFDRLSFRNTYAL